MFRKKIAGSWTDDTFLTALYAEERYIYRISYLYLKHEQEALENVQEVAFRAWKYRKSLQDVTNFKTWLTRITINAAQDRSEAQIPSFEHLVVDQLY